MCQFVVFNHEEFTNPIEMFILGLLVIISNVLGQVTNAIILLKQDTVEGMIGKFVTFKVLFQI